MKIQVCIPELKKYFLFDGIRLGGKYAEDYSTGDQVYEKVKSLLSEYGIHDQKQIDNFSFLEMIFRGQFQFAKEDLLEIGSMKQYEADLASFLEFLKEYNIKGILFKGKHKTAIRNRKSVSFQNPNFINGIMNELSGLIEHSERKKDAGIFEESKRRKGAEEQITGTWLKDTFFRLRGFMQNPELPQLHKLKESEVSYFAGKLFTIAGIIDPFEHEIKDRAGYKSEKDYLIKRMDKYR